MKEWAGWAVLIEWGGGRRVFLLVKEKGVNVFSVGVVDSYKSFWTAMCKTSTP